MAVSTVQGGFMPVRRDTTINTITRTVEVYVPQTPSAPSTPDTVSLSSDALERFQNGSRIFATDIFRPLEIPSLTSATLESETTVNVEETQNSATASGEEDTVEDHAGDASSASDAGSNTTNADQSSGSGQNVDSDSAQTQSGDSDSGTGAETTTTASGQNENSSVSIPVIIEGADDAAGGSGAADSSGNSADGNFGFDLELVNRGFNGFRFNPLNPGRPLRPFGFGDLPQFADLRLNQEPMELANPFTLQGVSLFDHALLRNDFGI
ncbi:MAG: hypothetical protein QGG53_26695 [Planctomycetota bacterium]|jgi:hypothetical protein|nr:hypothetical protein [Planctomycetota bacterium]